MGEHTDIPWREWGREAFEEAKREGKPVLLDLSAVWCHWCHVMDETTYSDDEVIRIIKEGFIPVRVDIDRRPDIRDRYSLFGGWPTTAFLNHSGEVVTGATYIPPNQMLTVLPQVKEFFDKHGGNPPVQVALPRDRGGESPAGDLTAQIVEDVLGYILVAFDETFGGLGTAPKFPHPEPVDLLLQKYHEGGNKEFLKVVTTTLDIMAKSGTYDPLEGGFFRYSTTRDWSIPHFEKMCDVNAGLLRNYVNAYAVTGRGAYGEVAADIMRYVNASLADPAGGFYGSQDADEVYYGLQSKGEREAHGAPYIDKTLYSDLNGMMAHSYLRAYSFLGDEEALLRATRALDRILADCRHPGGPLYHHYDGSKGIPGLLSDHAWMVRALTLAHGATGEVRFLDAARELGQWAIDHLRGPSGAFRDRLPEEDDVGFLAHAEEPLQDNSVMAEALMELAELTGEEGFREAAHGALRAFVDSYDRFGFFAAAYARAVERYLLGSTKLVVVAGTKDLQSLEFRRSVLASYQPRRVVQLLDPADPSFGRFPFPPEPSPALYICVGKLCSSPVTQPEELRERVKAFVQEARP